MDKNIKLTPEQESLIGKPYGVWIKPVKIDSNEASKPISVKKIKNPSRRKQKKQS